MIETAGHFPGERISSEALKVVEGFRIQHWELALAIYHISFHLSDAVPSAQLAEWREARDYYRTLRAKRELTADEIAEMKRLHDEKIERYLSSGSGCCALRASAASEAVARVIEHGQGVDYQLHELTVMPNHVHVIASPLEGRTMKALVDQWKSVSAHALVKCGAMKAPVWQRDHYSRIIRNAEEYKLQMEYVWHNPDAAGLADGYLRKRYA